MEISINSKEFENILLTENGERAISSYLADNPLILFHSFCKTGGHSNFILREFTLGSRYKADFVILWSYSGGWDVHFIELEPIKDNIFTKNRTPTKKLNIAIRQLQDWKEFSEQQNETLRFDLAEWAKKRDILWKDRDRNHEPSSYAGQQLRDPKTYIYYKYHIIIGRRDKINEETRNLMSRIKYQDDIDIRTYDRILDVAKNLEKC